MTMGTASVQPLRAWLARAEYERKASLHDLPPSVIATRPHSGSDEWHEGTERDFMHDCWRICTADRSKVYRGVVHNIYFDVVVDYGGVRLSDDTALHDCLTKKLMCLAALTTGLVGKTVAAGGVVGLCTRLDNFIRWRRSIGLNRNSSIERQHFDHFVSLLSKRALDMVPVYDRLERLAEDVRNGLWSLPTKPARFKVHPEAPESALLPDWEALASLLGVSPISLTNSREFRAKLDRRLPDLYPSHARELRRGLADADVPERGLRSAAQISGLLLPWSYISHFTGNGMLDHDPISFSPFGPRSLVSVAEGIGLPRGRTATLQPERLMCLLDVAAKWVLDYAPHIIAALEIAKTDKDFHRARDAWTARLKASEAFDRHLPDAMPRLWMGWTTHSGRGTGDIDRLSLGGAAAHLLTACAVLIGAFGGRRIGEITSLRAGCIEEAKPGLCELTIYIEKTLKDHDRIPVPGMLKVVVNVLEQLTADTREATGEGWLFRVGRTSLDSNHYVGFQPDRNMEDFARFNGLMPAGSDLKPIRPHQLRRAFAVVYYHGFRGASLDSLSRFLRHFDPETTRIYINEILGGAMGRLREEINARTRVSLATMSDEDRGWLKDAKSLLKDLADRASTFDDVRCEEQVHRLLQAWDGTESPIGRGAARLYADLDALAAQAATDVRVGPRSNDPGAMRAPMEAALKKYVAAHFLEAVPGRAAHCSCRPRHAGDLAEAECLKAKAGRHPDSASNPSSSTDAWPDHAYSGMYVCLTCTHCAAFSDDQQVIAKHGERLENAASSGASPAAREDAAERFARHKAMVAAARAASANRAPK